MIPVAPRPAAFLLFTILVILQRVSDHSRRLFPDLPVDKNKDGGCYGENTEYVDATRPQRIARSRNHSRRLFQANSLDCDERHSHPGGNGYSVRIIQDSVVKSCYLLL